MSTNFDDLRDEAIITPQMIYGDKREICSTCMITFSSEILQYALNRYNNEVIGNILSCSGDKPIYGITVGGKTVGLYRTEVGSCMAGNMLIEANWVTGATSFVMFGSAGVLNREAAEGKIVVPTAAYRDEGMSFHYAEAGQYIAVKNSGRVAKVFEEMGVPHVLGKTWTTDAIYRETKRKMERLKGEGCLTVEMEVAGVQAVCDFYGFELYNFLFTGDVLDMPEWSYAALNEANHEGGNFDMAAEFVRRIL